MSLKRITKEWVNSIRNPAGGISIGPFGDDMHHMKGVIDGPIGTSFEGGYFLLDIHLPELYPFKPPKITFTTPVFHPNIDGEGNISLGILKEGWAPGITIVRAMLAIRALMTDPNPDDPLVPEVFRLYTTDRQKYEQTVREWTEKYAM